jgi:hypothetical protein
MIEKFVWALINRGKTAIFDGEKIAISKTG